MACASHWAALLGLNHRCCLTLKQTFRPLCYFIAVQQRPNDVTARSVCCSRKTTRNFISVRHKLYDLCDLNVSLFAVLWRTGCSWIWEICCIIWLSRAFQSSGNFCSLQDGCSRRRQMLPPFYKKLFGRPVNCLSRKEPIHRFLFASAAKQWLVTSPQKWVRHT